MVVLVGVVGFSISANGFVYEKLRVCTRGFSEGKSDVENVQRLLFKPKPAIFYIRCWQQYFFIIQFGFNFIPLVF